MTPILLAFLLVAAGGALGALLRHWVSRRVGLRLGHAAFGTLAVNISGAFVIGATAAIGYGTGTAPGDRWPWLLLVTGVLGSYTTVSSLSLQTLELAHGGKAGAALGNIGASLVLGLAAAALGFAGTFALMGLA